MANELINGARIAARFRDLNFGSNRSSSARMGLGRRVASRLCKAYLLKVCMNSTVIL